MRRSTEKEGPKPTGSARAYVTLTGLLIPWADDDQPALLNVPGSAAIYLPVFSDGKLLRATMERARTPYAKVKRVDDGEEFLASIPVELRIMIDPRFTPEGKVRFNEVQR